MLLDGAGGECTFMWHSNHPSHFTIPERLCIGVVRDYEDFYNYSGDFYKEMCVKVEKLLPKDKRRGEITLQIK